MQDVSVMTYGCKCVLFWITLFIQVISCFIYHKEVFPRMANETRTSLVEQHSIDFIPEAERHGSVFSLFTLWFAANMQITTVVTGALAVIIGLPLIWALV